MKMGRSVSHPSAARVVTYLNLDLDENDDADWVFENLIDGFRDTLNSMFPSVKTADDWIGREDHVVAENRLARFGISEYCGLVAYWIVPTGEDDGREAMSWNWIDGIASKFIDAFGNLRKTGSMSNGEGVFQKIN
jgi:hypothetical protein